MMVFFVVKSLGLTFVHGGSFSAALWHGSDSGGSDMIVPHSVSNTLQIFVSSGFIGDFQRPTMPWLDMNNVN